MLQHTDMQAHDGYALHSHEVRLDHAGVKTQWPPASAREFEVRAEGTRYPEDVSDDIWEAVKTAAVATDAAGLVSVTDRGVRVAAIVPLSLVEYALRHGWGR